MTVNASVIWSAVASFSSADVAVGYCMTTVADGLVVATDANLATSLTGRVDCISMTPAQARQGFNGLVAGTLDKLEAPFVGAGATTDFANRDSLGRVVRSAALTTDTVGVCGADGSVIVNLALGPLSTTIGSGAGALTAVVGVAIAAGDGLTTANHASDATRMTKGTRTNMLTGFHCTGIALLTVPSLGLVLYALPGATVPAATLGLSATGTTSWAILDPVTARVVRKKNPDPADVVVGEVNQQGNLLFDSFRVDRSDLIATWPPYFADNTGTTDCSAAFRQMVADADISVGESNLNFSSKRCFIPKGKYKLDKPVHVNIEAQKWAGEERLTTHIMSFAHVGPQFYFAPDIGVFPNTPNALNGRMSLQVRHHPLVQDEHWLPLSEYGSPKVNGKPAMSVEFILAVQSSTDTNSTFILASYGERFKNDTAWGYSECFGVFFAGSAGFPNTNCFGFTITTTAGIQSVYTPTNSVLPNGAYHRVECNWSSGQMRVFIDGILQTLSVTGGSSAIGGTLVQKAHENMCFGEVFAFPLTLRRYSSADIDLWSLRISDIARNTANYGSSGGGTPLLPASFTKFTADNNTVLGMLTDDSTSDSTDTDGVFVKGWCRTGTNTTTRFPAYWPHRRDNLVVVGGMAGVGFSNCCFTSLYGTPLDLNSTFDSAWENITIIAGNCGIRMDNNCFKSNLKNVYIGGSNSIPVAQKARYGITMTNAANVMFMSNIMVSGFSYNLVLSGAGDASIGGSYYSTSSDIHMLLINTLNFTMVCDSEMSDEASAATGFAPEAFLGLVNVEQSLFGNFQVSQAEGVLSVIKWEGDTSLPGGNSCKHKFLTPYMFGNSASPGTIEVTSPTAPLGTITLDDSLLKSTVPVITAGSPDGTRVIMHPEGDIVPVGVVMTDANLTLLRDTWIRNNRMKITGTLTAGRTVTVPRAMIGRRTIENATTGGFALTIKANGGTTTLSLANGATATYMCDGTDVMIG